MFRPRIRIDRRLYRRLEEAARRAGYATTEELVVHVLEREASRLEEEAADEEAEKQLRGLGYIE